MKPTRPAPAAGFVGAKMEGHGRDPQDFLDPALAAGHGVRVHNLYNLYIYFWRWALWKVFESKTAAGPGVASYISASSYLEGDAFCGMREHMRRLCDEIWILDLGGEGRGTARAKMSSPFKRPWQSPWPFVTARRRNAPAKVRYAAIVDGTRDKKLKALDAVVDFASLTWQDCPDDWHAPFRPAGAGAYFDWPSITSLFPWQQGGVKAGRTWVIAPIARRAGAPLARTVQRRQGQTSCAVQGLAHRTQGNRRSKPASAQRREVETHCGGPRERPAS